MDICSGVSKSTCQTGLCTFNGRIALIAFRGALGVLLLSDVSFKSTYQKEYVFPIQRAGLSPMNASLADYDGFNLTATAEFWSYFPALLTDSKRVRPVAPLSCSGEMCNSFFIPGSMMTILLEPDLPPIQKDNYSSAVSYIQNDAPGYQIEFYPIDPVRDPPMTPNDCRVYGLNMMAIQICLKKSESSMMAGTSFSKCHY